MNAFSKKILFVLLAVAIVNQLEIGVLLPLIPNLFVNPEFAYTFLDGGITTSLGYVFMSMCFFSFAFAQFISSPVLGKTSDLKGRRKVLIGSGIGIALGHFLFGLGIVTHSLPMLFAGRLLAGIGDGVAGVFFAAIADITTEENRSRSFGIIASASGIGLILGASISYFFSGPSIFAFGSPLLPLWILIASSFANLFLIFFCLPETNTKFQKRNISLLESVNDVCHALIESSSRRLYATLLFFIMSITLFITYSPAFLIQELKISQSALSAAFILFGITIALAQVVFIPFILKRFDAQIVVSNALIFLCMLVFLYGSVKSIALFYLLTFLAAICVGTLYTSIMGLISTSHEADIQGRTMGLATSVQSFAQFAPGIFSGFIALQFGVTGPIYMSGMILFLVGTASYFILKIKNRIEH